MKKILFITILALPLGIFAQENNANPQVKIQTANYFGELNNANDIIQADIGNQQAAAPAQAQQSSGNFFGSEESDNSQAKSTAGCKDCDAVKAAVKASHAASKHKHRNIFSVNAWRKKASARTNLKMRKIFAHKRKIKCNYEVCFNWH